MATTLSYKQEGQLSEKLGTVIEKIVEESPLTQGLEQVIESVKPELRNLQEVLEDVESKGDKMEAKLVSLKVIINQIDSYLSRLEKQRRMSNKCVTILGNAKARYEFRRKMKSVKLRIQDIIKEYKDYKLSARAESSSSQQEQYNLQGSSHVVGRQEDIKKVRNRLILGVRREYFGLDVLSLKLFENITHSGQLCLSAVSIVGGEGVGKTTLASSVYKDAEVSRIFSSRAWVTVPHKFDDKELLCSIAKQFVTIGSDEPDQSWNLDSLRENIHFSIGERPYLIVLDDVRKPDVWRLLQQVLPNTYFSKVLITTQVEEVATNASFSSGNIHHLQKLTKDDSYQLFCTILDVPSGLQQLAQEIVENCNGKPGLILETASILSREAKTVERWSTLLSELKQKHSLQHFAADALPSYLKKCLYSFLLFDKDLEIPARRLTALWIAEGLVQPELLGIEVQPLEVVAKKYLLNLRSCFMIEVLKTKANGEIKTCRLRTAIREALRLKAIADNFFYNPSCNRIHRLALHPQRNDSNNEVADYCWSFYGFTVDQLHGSSLSPCFKYLRSFSSFDPREGPEPGEQIKTFLHKCIKMGGCKWLRVLDLEGVFRPILPEALVKELSELRYLSLRRSYAEWLPQTVGSLRKLQMLDLKHTCISMVPKSIWKLKALRHLYLSESYHTRLPFQPSVAVSLNSLQTLSGGFMDDQAPVEKGLDNLKDLRKLVLTCQMSKEKQQDLGHWIVKLTQLETLRLRSIDEMVEPSQLYIECLSSLTKLNSLYLFGVITIDSSSTLSTLPENLMDITLSLSKLEQDPMPVLGRLPKLRRLSLLSDSYMGKNLTCPISSFLMLRSLKLWKLKELEKLTMEQEAMPDIEAIEIRSCRKLKFITKQMEHLTSFQ